MNDVNRGSSAATNEQAVPFDRFKEVNDERKANAAKAEATATENASLKAQLAGLQNGNGTIGVAPGSQTNAPEVKPSKIYSRTELETAVKAGTITEVEANTLWDQQQADQIANRVKTEVTETLTATTQKDETKSLLARYMAAKPDAVVEGTEDRKAVAKKFENLVTRGYESVREKGGDKTELLALELVFGPIETLEAAKDGHNDPDTHVEIGGAGGAGEGSTGGMPKGLTPKQKMFYGGQIQKGIYANWAEVTAELEYQNTDLSKRSSGR